MRRGQKTCADQVMLKPFQIEVQTAQGVSLALACKETEISEQSYDRWRKECGGLQVDQVCTDNFDVLSVDRCRTVPPSQLLLDNPQDDETSIPGGVTVGADRDPAALCISFDITMF